MTDNYAAGPRPLTVVADNGAPCAATRLVAHESLTDGFRLEVSLVSEQPLNRTLPGRMVTVSYRSGEAVRTFSGLAESLECDGWQPEKSLWFYRITATDPVTFLHHGRQRRLFQNQNSKGQITTLLGLHQLSAFIRFAPGCEGETVPCRCQTDESDGAMIRRIIASEGWFYFRSPQHTTQWTVCDTVQHAPQAAPCQIPFQVTRDDDGAHITGFRACYRATAAQFSAAVWSQEQHKSRIENHSLKNAGTHQVSQQFDERAGSARAAGEAAAVAAHYFDAESDYPPLCAGMRFQLTGHPADGYDGDYYVSSVIHTIECSEQGGQVQYQNRFRCHPAALPFRLPPAEKPRCDRIESATVTGPENSETHYDAQGRVKVRFHWETESDGRLSQAWLPVIAPAAGPGAGVQFLPRVGDAVVVQFLNGDPDQPVVSGALWHRSSPRPFSSPSVSGIYSRSTPDGARGAGNQLRFEDKRDNECLALSAERDLHFTAKNDWISQITGVISTETAKTLTVTSKEEMTYRSEKQWALTAQTGIRMQTPETLAMQADDTLSGKAKTLTLSAKQAITLTVGSSKIELSPSGITVQAPQITVKGSGKVTLESAVLSVTAQAKAQLSGAIVQINGSALTEVKAGAMVQISGALTKIN